MRRPLAKDAGLRTQEGKLAWNPKIESLKDIVTEVVLGSQVCWTSWCTFLILVLGRQRHADLYEFEASLVYIASSGPAKTSQKANKKEEVGKKSKSVSKVYAKPNIRKFKKRLFPNCFSFTLTVSSASHSLLDPALGQEGGNSLSLGLRFSVSDEGFRGVGSLCSHIFWGSHICSRLCRLL